MVKIDERYCVFPPMGQFGLYIRFEPKEEGENDPHIRILSVKRWKDTIVLNKSPVAPKTIASINATKKLNRQIRFVSTMAEGFVGKMAQLVAENIGSTVIQDDPFVKKVEERKAEKTVENDLEMFSEFK